MNRARTGQAKADRPKISPPAPVLKSEYSYPETLLTPHKKG